MFRRRRNWTRTLFDNRFTGALKDTFNTSGSFPAGWYWSSSPFDDGIARVQWFGDGGQHNYYRNFGFPVRLVW